MWAAGAGLVAVAAWLTSVQTMRGTSQLTRHHNTLFFGRRPSDVPGALPLEPIEVAWARIRRVTAESIEESLTRVRSFQEAAKTEDRLFEEFTPRPDRLPEDIEGLRFHDDGFLSPLECDQLTTMFERIVVPGTAGEAYGTSQYTTASFFDLKYQSQGSLSREEEDLYWSVRQRVQQRLKERLGVQGQLHVSAAHITMRNVLPWLGCADAYDCGRSMGGRHEDVIGGMSYHQDGCVWPHDRRNFPPHDPLASMVNYSQRVLDRSRGEFYEPDDCRRKKHPNWEYPTYTAIVFLNGAAGSDPYPGGGSSSGACSPGDTPGDTPGDGQEGAEGAETGGQSDPGRICRASSEPEGAEGAEGAEGSRVRGGEFAWINRMSDHFDRVDRSSWIEHQVSSNRTFSSPSPLLQFIRRELRPVFLVTQVSVIQPTCGRLIGFTTDGTNPDMVHRVLEGTRFAMSVNFHPSFRQSELVERVRVLSVRFLLYLLLYYIIIGAIAALVAKRIFR